MQIKVHSARALAALVLTLVPFALQARFENFSDVTYSGTTAYYDVGGNQGVEDWSGTGEAGYFESGSAVYYNQGLGGYSWYGISYSKIETGSPNEYAAVTRGGANADGSVHAGGSYAIVYQAAWLDTPTAPTSALLELSGMGAAERIDSLLLTNTEYTATTLKNGNPYAKKFEQGDWLKLTVYGYDSEMAATGSVDFYLADFTSDVAEEHYIVSAWEELSLASLGDDTRFLAFGFTSSDTGDYGINSPTYAALGGLNFAAIPEPSALCAGLFGLVVLCLRRRR